MTMRRWFAWQGAVAGIAVGGALVWALAMGWLTGGAPILAAALSERARALLPLRVLGWFIVTFKFDAKPLGYWITIGTVLVASVIAGGILGARRLPLWAVAVAVVIAVAAALAVIAAPPSLTYLSARLGAEGVTDADAQALQTVALAIAGYAVLAGAVFTVVAGLLRRRQIPIRARAEGTTFSLHGRGH
jgi:hypothetical protein